MNYNRDLAGVVIDPGHGGSDSGAVGNGIIEKDLTLDISKYMYNRFKELGIPVALTRDSDETLNSNDRPKVALSKFGSGKNVILISNHINAGGGEGAEVIYALRNTDRLSTNILNELERSGQVIRKSYQRRLPSNTSKDYYYIIRETPNNETVIVEYGFLDNISDSNRLKQNYKKYAEAVVKAVSNYAGYKYVPVVGSGEYIVKSGDTLWSISKKTGLTVDELKKINNLSGNLLSVGQVLNISKDDGNQGIDNNNYYIVKKGDTLYSIARKFNIGVNELKKINSLSSDILSIGQKILVYSNNYNNNYYVVKAGDTLYSIAKLFNTDVSSLKKINNLSDDNLSIGQKLLIPNDSYNQNINLKMYTVKKGDTLYSIAKEFNVSVSDIKKINDLNSNILSIGQNLYIPS